MVKKNVRNAKLDQIMFRIQKKLAVSEGGTCQFEFRELVQFESPQMHDFEEKSDFANSRNPVFIFFVESGQPYYGPVMDSEWP